MKVHNINIDSKYFEPIREGKITLLIFNKKVLYGIEQDDCIIASKGSYDVKAKIVRTYIKSFKEITENEAQKMGFLDKNFLKDELVRNFDLDKTFDFDSGYITKNIDNEIFFLVEITPVRDVLYKKSIFDDEKNCTILTEDYSSIYDNLSVNLYSKEYNKEFYNPEYDIKPWRDI